MVLAFAGLLAWLSVTEYKPAERVALNVYDPGTTLGASEKSTDDPGMDFSDENAGAGNEVENANSAENAEGAENADSADNAAGTEGADGTAAGGTAENGVQAGESFSIMTWNIGYGALGDNADFFMDGGKGVKTATETRVKSNLSDVETEIIKLNPDFTFLQEVDRDSMRSYGMDEAQLISDQIYSSGIGQAYDTTFAWNYRVGFIPYPVPPIGKVNSGILTLSSRQIDDSERVQLPCPFSWPVRLGNLKRCLMIDRVPVTDADGNRTGRELVLVNLHLEAYDDGEGKAAQTQMLSEIIENEVQKGNYVIAAGDFNQSFSGTDTSMYPAQEGKWECGLLDESAFSDSWNFYMDAATPTCRSLDQPYASADRENFQYYVIDGFIVSNNIEVGSVETQDLGFVASDHNPVLMNFTLGE